MRDTALLADRVVLVTGANGALGDAAARACAAAGAAVVLLGRRVPKLQRLHDALAAIGPAPAIYAMDLLGATPADYADMAKRIDDEFGRLDGILHAAAEFQGLTPLQNTDPSEFVNALHVNVGAPMLLTQACLPLLRRAPDSAVVFVMDDLERVGRAYWGGYGIAKFALQGLLRVFADELENSSVRVSALQPGPMQTPLRARAFMSEVPGTWPPASVYASACVRLLSAAGGEHRGQVWAPTVEPSRRAPSDLAASGLVG
ncbi:MAG TPA: SDR family NAD(P)-dependent oxidoreductase [Xanthomonadaceae bacterium]|jgi:NAD(P)-dependent dehydrogenase (short-subunit alcohol dehydrogenase family)|nr:SDR family NAD(P)-dependent oxidoreductase [Xanthomonadaceae bacterium]